MANFHKSENLQKQIQAGKLLVEQATLGNIKEVEDLLNEGVSVDAREYTKELFYSSLNFKSPLQSAVKNNHVEVVKTLLENGADIDFEDRYGITALHIAAEEGHFQCMKLLLDNEADPNKGTKTPKWCPNGESDYFGEMTPLHLAVKNNRVHCIKELIMNGADYNKVNELGETSLNIAASLGLEECVTIQLNNAVSRDILSLPTRKEGNTPLHCCVMHSMYNAVDLLLQHGSDVNILNNIGVSPLHLACTLQCSNLQILELMLKKGFNVKVDVPDLRGNTPLKCASVGSLLVEKTNRDRQPQLAALLIAYGADYRKVQDRKHQNLLERELRYETMDNAIIQAIVQSEVSLPSLETIVNARSSLPQYHNQSLAPQPGGHQMNPNANPMVHPIQPFMQPNQQRNPSTLQMQMLTHGSVHRAVRLLRIAGHPAVASDLGQISDAYIAGAHFVPQPPRSTSAGLDVLRRNGLPHFAEILQFHYDSAVHLNMHDVHNAPVALLTQPAAPLYRPLRISSFDTDSEDEGLVVVDSMDGDDFQQNVSMMDVQDGQVIDGQNGQAVGTQNGQALADQNGQVRSGQSRQVMGSQNGQVMAGQSGQAMGIQDGQAIGSQNGYEMGGQNSQASGSQNRQPVRGQGNQNRQAGGNQGRHSLAEDEISFDASMSAFLNLMPSVRNHSEATYLRERQEWYKKITQSPFSLHHYCRYNIRKAMGPSRLRRVSELNLPPTLTGYILLQGEDLRL